MLVLPVSRQSEEKPITMYFNVPGANIKPGKFSPFKPPLLLLHLFCHHPLQHVNTCVCVSTALAVFDVMRRLKCPVVTINMGLTVGMGALLCAVGSPGQR